MKKIMLFSLLVVSLVLFGCSETNDGLTEEEQEILGEDSSFAGMAVTTDGCKVGWDRIYSNCVETETGITVTQISTGRSVNLLDRCATSGYSIDYSCRDDTTNGLEYCRKTCEEGCHENRVVCQEDYQCAEGTYEVGAEGTSVQVCQDGEWVAATCTGPEPCTAIPATACLAGVSCPGNVPVAALGCPEGQACTAEGVCASTPTCAEGSQQAICVEGVLTNQTCSGGSWTTSGITDCSAILGSGIGFGLYTDNSSTCLPTAAPPSCSRCGAKICSGEGYEFATYGLTCPSGYTDTGRVVSGDGCPVSCTDSDGSTSPSSIKGTLTVTLGSGRIVTYEDRCTRYGSLVEYSCYSGQSAGAHEYYRSGAQTCVDGAFVG